ncbi:hypothetical protein LAZ67_11001358 [Cordylochernes scorpioides]|uniref:Transposase n=1 Tax=Cordylochernes scorpioides TaxID=51811 RepID=A0ABY6L1T9_9ARAC|nr:hypothetical protein LAZ67_11001358 [Cordylochernes scorpioides]
MQLLIDVDNIDSTTEECQIRTASIEQGTEREDRAIVWRTVATLDSMLTSIQSVTGKQLSNMSNKRRQRKRNPKSRRYYTYPSHPYTPTNSTTVVSGAINWGRIVFSIETRLLLGNGEGRKRAERRGINIFVRRNSEMEQRAVIKFNAKLGRSASETYILMKQVYGTLCLSKSNVFIRHKRFSDGRNTLEDDKHTGRPSSSKTPESIEKVREFVANNRSASLRMMAEVLHINKETIRIILHEDLGKTKVCAKFVPHTLTGEQKSLRIAHCRDIISAYENDSNFLKSIVTGDETWCFQYDPKTKRQSAEWKSKNSPQAKKTRKVPSKIKTMLITFFDSRGIIHKEFVPAGQTITGEYYLNVLKRLIARIRRIRPEYRDENSWGLLHDNAPSHSSLIVRRFLAKNNVCVLNHPPYSPDLASYDFYLFPKIKLKLKGFFFNDIPTIQRAATSTLEAIPQSGLQEAFNSLLNRCNICIESGGDYFELKNSRN